MAIPNLQNTDTFKEWQELFNIVIDAINSSEDGYLPFTPSITSNDMIVSVEGGYLIKDGEIITISQTDVDLTASIPTTNDKVVIGVIDDGFVTFVSGEEAVSPINPLYGDKVPIFRTVLTPGQTQITAITSYRDSKNFNNFYTKSQIDNIISTYSVIDKPMITTPSEAQTDFYGQMSCSAFAQSDNFYGNHDKSNWQLSTDNTFTSVDIDEYDGNSNLTTWFPNYGGNPLTNMFVRVRFGTDNHWSAWSETISFTTANTYVQTPVLTVTGYPSSVPENPILSGGTFTVANGADTHSSTDWEIWDSSDTQLIWSSLNDTSNLESIEVPHGILEITTQYIFKVRYTGTTYGGSSYDIKTGTTLPIFIPAPILVGDSSINELSQMIVNISNYNATMDSYTITLSTGSWERVDDNITLTFGEYASDTIATLSVYSTESSYDGPTTDKLITIHDVPIVGDDAIQVTNFSVVQDHTDGFE